MEEALVTQAVRSEKPRMRMMVFNNSTWETRVYWSKGLGPTKPTQSLSRVN